MESQDPQKTWSDYYLRKKAQRVEEAGILWDRMTRAGVTDATVLALDFVHFGKVRADVEALAGQLAENYSMEVVPAGEQGYWLAKGTTRPQGITLTRDQHIGWVEFMADVANSYACVFSTWSFEAPTLGASFRSEDVESAS
ncbi:MAG TPA: hypothetical protein VFV84_04020 [Burkholderiales bacterium]|nr:hypothetical protein [Burkholderiales bacterium]